MNPTILRYMEQKSHFYNRAPFVFYWMKQTMLFVAFFSLSDIACCHKNDSIPVPYHWNVIKINPTPALLFGNPANISVVYERLVKPNQSFLVQLGYLGLPEILQDSVGGLRDVKKVSGLGVNLAFDYRFYVLRRNQYPAPDGLYLGSYLSYYGYTVKNEFAYYRADTILTSGDFSSKFNLVNLGVSLGYQFIFWKRVSIDLLIFGPSLTYFAYQREVSSNMTPADEEKLKQEIIEKFNEKFPILVPFVKPSEEAHSIQLRMFFRYSFSIGFHF